MGCSASSPVASAPPSNVPRAQEQQHPPPISASRAQPQPHAPAEPEPAAPARPAEAPAAADSTTFDFKLHTPMLVMPYAAFKAQGRIFKSVKVWREEARREGRLTVHAEAGRDNRGKIVVFISHTWWDREFLDPDRDPKDLYDKGAPDYQSGDKQDLKWRVICSGVESLVKQEGLNEEEVALWLDWQSIFQDDKTEKNKGVLSLLKYATLCDYMLVPTEEWQLEGFKAKYPEHIPGYGARGWCRCEYFIFSLAAEMREREVELYAILSGGGLQKYPAVKVVNAQYMPSGGAFANPDDQASVQKLENQMIKAYGKAVVVAKCKPGGAVDLADKMLRAVHMDALGAAVAKYEVEGLNLTRNQLRVDGGKALAALMSKMPSLKELIVENNYLGVEGGKAFAAVLKDTQLTNLNLANNALCGINDVGNGSYTAESITALCNGLKGSAVTSLNVLNNKLGDGTDALVAAAREMPQLVTLCGLQPEQADIDFRQRSLDSDDAKLLAFDLSKNQAIKTLNVGYNMLGVEGGKAFAAVLKDTQLTNLNLRSNTLGPDGGAAIAEGLNGNTTLKELNLSDNALCGLNQGGFGTYSAEGITALCEGLKGSAVTSLNISLNFIGVDGGKAIAAALKDTQITNLKLQGNSLNDDARQALREAAGNRVKLSL